MQFEPGLGVFGLTETGLWEDRSGTSFAAPILAREAAFTLAELQKVCGPGSRPYAVAAKAFLALTASREGDFGAAERLAERTLGRGLATSERLIKPRADTAILLWQGILDGPGDIARVILPIPNDWYLTCGMPTLRLVVSWDPPVNAAVENLWATRKVAAHLKANPDTAALRGSRKGHASYPLIDRFYDLKKLPKGVDVDGDLWVLELSYEEIADYHLGMTFTPLQKVAFAAELYDASEVPLSPQAAIQSLPSSVTMSRLTVQPQPVKTAVTIRSF